MPLSTHVSTPSGQKRLLAEGSRLIFGRGPDVDLIVAAGRGLSRRAGVVTVLAAGASIARAIVCDRGPTETMNSWDGWIARSS